MAKAKFHLYQNPSAKARRQFMSFMNKDTFWKILDDILNFGEFVVAVPNAAASANIVGKISIGRDGNERVIDKDACHCHIHLEPENIAYFSFTFIDVGFGEEPCIELKTHEEETSLRLYLRAEREKARDVFAEFPYLNSDFVKGSWL